MGISKIKKSLEMRGIPYHIENGEIYAASPDSNGIGGSECENLTNFSARDFYSWLGYEL